MIVLFTQKSPKVQIPETPMVKVRKNVGESSKDVGEYSKTRVLKLGSTLVNARMYVNEILVRTRNCEG